MKSIIDFAILKIYKFFDRNHNGHHFLQVYSISELDGFRAASGVFSNIGSIPSTANVQASEVIIDDFIGFVNAFGQLRTSGEGQPGGVAASPGVRTSVVDGHVGVFIDSVFWKHCI